MHHHFELYQIQNASHNENDIESRFEQDGLLATEKKGIQVKKITI